MNIRAIVGIGVALAFTSIGIMTGRAQAPSCLHTSSETNIEQARRLAALRYVRQINTAEATARAKTQRFLSLTELGDFQPPAGFHPQLSTDGTSYALAVKDTTDPCLFAFFSDQEGLIYTGAPIR